MSGAKRSAFLAHHYREAPQQIDKDGTRHWITRAANFVVVVSDAKAGALLQRSTQSDEYMLLLGPGMRASVRAGGAPIDADENSLTIFPPGDSVVEVTRDGYVVRVFSSKADDLTTASVNSAMYADGANEVAPIVAWPDPVGGFKLRHYPLKDYPSPDPSSLKMRLFRSTNMMINVFMPWQRARDITKLSPHSHEDFEQVTLCMEGAFQHHMRYPWTPDMTTWRADEHLENKSPAVLVIPAQVIHTSHNVTDAQAWLIDIFAPPRFDFSERPGFILNAADYPMPPKP